MVTSRRTTRTASRIGKANTSIALADDKRERAGQTFNGLDDAVGFNGAKRIDHQLLVFKDVGQFGSNDVFFLFPVENNIGINDVVIRPFRIDLLSL